MLASPYIIPLQRYFCNIARVPAYFYITIQHDRRTYRFRVSQKPSDEAFDYYEVSGANKKIVFRNNAPVFRRNGLKHRQPTWSVVTGDIWNSRFKEKLVQAINERISSDEC